MPPKRRTRAQAGASAAKTPTSMTSSTKSKSDSLKFGKQTLTSHMPPKLKADNDKQVEQLDPESDLENLMENLTPLPSDSGSTSSDSSSEEEDWENCLQETMHPTASAKIHDLPQDDLEITVEPSKAQSWQTMKKGISAVERTIRMTAHMLHVQFLLYHGFVRNSWLCDEELQAILLSHVTSSVTAQVEKYHQARQKQIGNSQKSQRKGKGKGKGHDSTTEPENTDTAAADPLVHLLGVLIHFWKKRFTIDAPGLRKKGYMSMGELSQLVNSKGCSQAYEEGKESENLMGERIENLNKYREMAGRLEGSRDVGAQLFTAFLRALGLETRMVFSLQPLGFSFHGSEIANGKEGVVEEPKIPSSTQGGTSEAVERGNRGHRCMEMSLRKRRKPRASESEEEENSTKSRKKQKYNPIDKDLQFPIFWTEVFSPHTSTWIAVDALVTTKIFFRPDSFCQLEPRGKQAHESKQVICYVIAYSLDSTAKDVTVRYLTKNVLPGKTKGFRVPQTLYPIKDSKGIVIRSHKYDWFRSIMRRYTIREDLKSDRDKQEDEALQGVIVERKRAVNEESISGYKNHPDFVLERHLKRDEAVKPGKSHTKLLKVGKGDNAKEECVYRRRDIVICKAIENWYKEGRVVKEGEQPLKRVKARAVTLNRKRELEQAAAENNPLLQGLYSYEQTKLYEPPPIQDGRVPRNAFGNCDVYVESMVPIGGAHLPLKGSAKIAKKLGIDFADAVTGFEFKKQRAIPVVEGIVIAAEYETLIRDAWVVEEKERKRKEDIKREQAALALWRKFLMGIRIVKRIQEEYGDEGEDVVASSSKSDKQPQNNDGKALLEDKKSHSGYSTDLEPEEGGFLRNAEDDPHGREHNHSQGGGFLADENHESNEGGFIQDDDKNADQTSGGFVTGLQHTIPNRENRYTRTHSQDICIHSSAHKRQVNITSRHKPNRNQAITSLKSASTATGADDEYGAASSDSSPDEGQVSKHFSPRNATSKKTTRLKRDPVDESDTSDLTDLDYMDVDSEIPRSARNSSKKAGVDMNDQQPPSSSHRSNQRGERDVMQMGQNNNFEVTESKPPKAAAARPEAQVAVKTTRILRTRTRSKYFSTDKQEP